VDKVRQNKIAIIKEQLKAGEFNIPVYPVVESIIVHSKKAIGIKASEPYRSMRQDLCEKEILFQKRRSPSA